MSGKRGHSGEVPDVTQLRDDIDVTEAPTLSATTSPGGSRGRFQEPPRNLLADIGRFPDRGEIGVGGMGSVREVYDEILLRRVAIKSLHNELAESEEHTQRFLEEVQITGQLDQAHIVPVHDVGFHPRGNAFFVMKLLKGRTLSRIIADQRSKPLSGRNLEEFLHTFIKVCDAIDFAHSRNVIHRDLKPSNIMVGDHGEVYVMDWGIALLADGPRHDPVHDPPQLRLFAQNAVDDVLAQVVDDDLDDALPARRNNTGALGHQHHDSHQHHGGDDADQDDAVELVEGAVAKERRRVKVVDRGPVKLIA